MRTKYLLVGLLAGILIATAGSAFAADVIERVTASIRTDYSVELDGQKADLQNAPLVYNGTSYLPVREIATMFGKDVDFQDGTIKLDTPKEEKTVIETDLETPKANEQGEWISLRELAAKGIDVQIGPEHNVMTIRKEDNSIKFHTTDVKDSATVEINLIDDEGTITVKSEKGFTYLVISQLHSAGISF